MNNRRTAGVILSITILVLVVWSLVAPVTTLAITSADYDAIYGNYPWPDIEDGCGVDGSSLMLNSSMIPSSTLDVFNNDILPKIEVLENDYQTAAAQLGIPWQLIAAIHYKEADNDPGRSLAAGELFESENPNGLEVLPTDRVNNYVTVMSQVTLPHARDYYGINLGMNNPLEDYAYTMLAHNRGAAYRNVPEEFDGPWSYMKSPYVYNGVTEDTVRQSYPDSGYWPNDETTPDPYNAEWGNTSWGELPSYRGLEVQGVGALAVYLLLGGPYSDTQINGVNVGCVGGESGGGGHITTEGYAFPQAVTKSALAEVGFSVNCTNEHPPSLPYIYQGCHHHYYAADIWGVPNQTYVVAAAAGTVSEYGKGSDRDVAICSLSDPYRVPKVRVTGSDGYSYYYTHMAPGSLTKAIGETVQAGEVIGMVGLRECAQDTSPHLHFDIRLVNEYNPFGWYAYYFEPGVTSNDGNSSFGAGWYVDPYPLLREWYKVLPE